MRFRLKVKQSSDTQTILEQPPAELFQAVLPANRFPIRHAFCFFTSALLHAVGLVLLPFVAEQFASLPTARPSEQAKPFDRTKAIPVLIYRPPVRKPDLPRITATEAPKSKQAPAGEIVSPQQAIASFQKAPPRPQRIYRPEAPPEIATQELVRNRVEIAGSKLPVLPPPPQPPPPPKPKTFVPPAAEKRPQSQARVEMPLDQAPQVAAANNQQQGPAVLQQALPKAAPKPFEPPPTAKPKRPARDVAVADAPPPTVAGGRQDTGVSSGRAFPIGGEVPGNRPPAPAPPPPAAGGTGANVSVAVLGVVDANAEEAKGSRTASFSRANRAGAPAQSGEPGGLKLPDLATGNPVNLPPKAGNPPAAPGVSPATRQGVAVRPMASNRTPGTAVPLPPGNRRLPAAVEGAFAGRPVFASVIPMGDVRRHGADWTVWFAEAKPSAAGGSRWLTPPVPLRKLETNEGLPQPGEPEQTFRFSVLAEISEEGKIKVRKVVKSGNLEMDAFVIADLGEWTFQPATAPSGKVGVEVVLDVPFRFKKP